MKNCYLCNNQTFRVRPGVVRDNTSLNILECDQCGLVFLSGNEHIEDFHYENSGMHGDELISEGSWLKENEKDDERRLQFLKPKLVNKRLLDFGCGIGGFLIKSKAYTELSEGVELELRLQSYFSKVDLKVWKNLEEVLESNEKYDIITAFHVIEHVKDPIAIIKSLTKMLKPDGEIIIEVPSSSDALLTLYKSESFSRFTYWSQHLYLFNSETFRVLIQKSGLKINWLKQIQRYSLANHLYWLSNGKPGGHHVWSFLETEAINREYEAQLASVDLCDTLIASITL
ncbi:class I SAM-dependent methyltransferase [Leptospira sp. 201903070]|jgi:2-polyprenyl-3-methyl-5-hydroxy-6-metoxy-1,4-benzoquinol methylase|uniref:Class I SAM-dependent methyltransferase n=1 Tax=Leptospira ainlahdjerensis TaxID=2810033 RepID=A0ABS2UBI0_9LEPT|nr:class I SAM-dependent methyltransferase [Leptospira ainlahdjerensis]MBM9577318.1 class I SAM-dependent methyltransferase [Leptospira ainlahdjerensis]